MSEPQVGLEAVLPGWFIPVFLLAVIVGTVANNAMTAYSSGLALQSIGVRLRRSRSVLLDGTLGVALTLYALLVSNFLDTVSNLMQFAVDITGPLMASTSAISCCAATAMTVPSSAMKHQVDRSGTPPESIGRARWR